MTDILRKCRYAVMSAVSGGDRIKRIELTEKRYDEALEAFTNEQDDPTSPEIPFDVPVETGESNALITESDEKIHIEL